MDVQAQVGETAGRVWHVLHENGPLTLTQLKKKLNGSGELLNFALGWLSREDKVKISPEKKSYRIQLR